MIKIKETGRLFLVCGEKMEALGLRESEHNLIVFKPCNEAQTTFMAYPNGAMAVDKDMLPGSVALRYDIFIKDKNEIMNEKEIMNKKEIMNEKRIIETLFRNLLKDQLKLYGLNFQMTSQSLNVVSEEPTVLFQIELYLASGGYLLECEVRHCGMKLKYLDNAANEILYEYRDEIIEFLTK